MNIDKILAWKTRCETWSKSVPNKHNYKEPIDVNYHWGFHAGAVTMAKEALEIMQCVEEKLSRMDRLEAFAKRYAWCPRCSGIEKCQEHCNYLDSNYDGNMVLARKALFE